MSVTWPDLSFPPINLNILPPAWWFYATREEREIFAAKLNEGEENAIHNNSGLRGGLTELIHGNAKLQLMADIRNV